MIALDTDNGLDTAQTEPGAGDYSWIEDATNVPPPGMADVPYTKPPIGGEFGVGGTPVFEGAVDGGAAELTNEGVTYPAPATPAAVVFNDAGRSANPSTKANLYPWLTTPGTGLKWKIGAIGVPALAMEGEQPPGPPPLPAAHGVTFSSSINNGTGAASFSGPAQQDAAITVEFAIEGEPTQHVHVPVTAGQTASQIAAAVRGALNDYEPLALVASGTGGSVSVICDVPDVLLTSFSVSVT